MSNLYIPPNCQSLDKETSRQQIRLGIQGYPGTGKTWSALTFRNPIVFNLDRGLTAHQGRSDVIEIPFYKKEFCSSPELLKDKIIEWLEQEGHKLSQEQTLVFDGSTSLQNAYHTWWNANQHNYLSKGGKVDDFAEWKLKKQYFGQIMEIFKSLKCDIVYISHEAEKADKPTTIGQSGEYNGKIRPLLSGAFCDELIGYFTDWFRQLTCDKPPDDKLTPEVLDNWKMTKTEFKDMCNSFPRNTIYYWQTESDNKFDAKAGSLVNFPRFLPANFGSFNKWMRQIKQPTVTTNI